ncbi:hypothetical protein OROMI_023663 [Orobanche minor]
MGIPEVELNSGYKMPLLGLGTASFTTSKEDEVKAMLHAIECGYRHFDTAAHYGSEEAVGEAVAEAVKRGLVKSRSELFICSKLWASDNHAERVLPALKKSLQDRGSNILAVFDHLFSIYNNLKLDYIDLYLIHWPVAVTQESAFEYPVSNKKNVVPFDCKDVWPVMEEALRLGLVKSIGVSNFSCKKLEDLLSFATIPPTVNQVELNPLWQQKKLVDFCKARGIVVTGYSLLGSARQFWGSDRVVGIPTLKEIAKANAKSVPQVILRWAHQHGVATVAKSYNPQRMQENMDIFYWKLSEEECEIISKLPQARGSVADGFVSDEGAIKSVEDLWDGEL